MTNGQSTRGPLETLIRRISYVIIAIFLVALVLFFVIPIFFSDPARTARFFGEEARSPYFWAFAAGPPLFWLCLVVMYFGLPRETRAIYVTTRRSYRFGAIATLFRSYRSLHGLWPLLIILVASGSWSVAMLWGICLTNSGPHETAHGLLPWLIAISTVWLCAVLWLLVFSKSENDPALPGSHRAN